MAKSDIQEMAGAELLGKVLEEQNIYRLEGETGIKNLNKIAEILGYREDGFRYGSALERFLQDNPGACESLVDWIGEWTDRCPEWRETLEGVLEPKEEEEDADEE